MISEGTVIGPYKILAQIGAGGMGAIYRAQDTRLGRDVAIKLLHPTYKADRELLRRFELEARTIGDLNHPNLVTLFDVGSWEERPYLVMELLTGQSLRQALAGKPMATRRTVEIVRAVAEGLHAAHGKGIIHRDLKPENIFICQDRRVKVLDFGLAKLWRRPDLTPAVDERTLALVEANSTQVGMILGTLGYMSPEQIRGKALDGRSDLFALGIVLWELLTGTRPFQGESQVEIMYQVLEGELPDLDPALKVSPLLERIVRTCLSKDPDLRFHTAHDLIFALDAESQGTSAVAPLRTRSKLTRPRLLAAAGVLALLGLGVVGGHRLRPRPEPHMERLNPAPWFYSAARFLPDGKSVAFTGSPDAADSHELYLMGPGTAPQSVGVKDAKVLGISPRGDIALYLHGDQPVLAVRSLEGGTPRVISDRFATPDDQVLWVPGEPSPVICHANFQGRKIQGIEFQGRCLFEASPQAEIGAMAALPGRRIAFVEKAGWGQRLRVLSLDGAHFGPYPLPTRVMGTLYSKGNRLLGLAVPDEGRSGSQLVEMDDRGRLKRMVRAFEGLPNLYDVHTTGDVLISPKGWEGTGVSLRWLAPGAANERPVSAGRFQSLSGLSRDGHLLAFNSWNGTPTYQGKLQRAGAPEVMPITEGPVATISPDNLWVLVWTDVGSFRRFQRVPVGPGKSTHLPGNWLTAQVRFAGTAQKVFLFGRQAGDPEGPSIPYLCDVEAGTLTRLPWSAAEFTGPLSPDGQWAMVRKEQAPTATWYQVNLLLGTMLPLPSAVVGKSPVGWSTDGKSIWLLSTSNGSGAFPLTLWRCSVKNGTLTRVQQISGPTDRNAIVTEFDITADGAGYVYEILHQGQVAADLYRVTYH